MVFTVSRRACCRRWSRRQPAGPVSWASTWLGAGADAGLWPNRLRTGLCARRGSGTGPHGARWRRSPAKRLPRPSIGLQAQRIGHGTTLLDSPLVLDKGAQAPCADRSLPDQQPAHRRDCCPKCPSSARWLTYGVAACVCTDNTLLSGDRCPVGAGLAATLPGMTEAGLRRIIACGHRGAFVRRT